MARKVSNEGLRKVPVTVSVPKYIADGLKNQENKSETVTRILQENSSRILSGNISEANKYKKATLKKIVIDKIKENKKDVYKQSPYGEIDDIYSKIDKMEKELDDIKEDLDDISVDPKEYHKELRKTLSKIVEDSLKEVENEFETGRV